MQKWPLFFGGQGVGTSRLNRTAQTIISPRFDARPAARYSSLGDGERFDAQTEHKSTPNPDRRHGLNRTLELTEEEAQELDLLIKRELRASEVGLNHSRNFAFKDAIKAHIAMLGQLDRKLDQSPKPM